MTEGAMTSETVDLSESPRRPSALTTVLVWTANIAGGACVAFMTCYAYHIGF
jgi:hypothetical protein